MGALGLCVITLLSDLMLTASTASVRLGGLPSPSGEALARCSLSLAARCGRLAGAGRLCPLRSGRSGRWHLSLGHAREPTSRTGLGAGSPTIRPARIQAKAPRAGADEAAAGRAAPESLGGPALGAGAGAGAVRQRHRTESRTAQLY